MENTDDNGLYILMLSVHGLIRGKNPELGRDADTGGQVKYVLELADALSERPEVTRVDLVTRMIGGKDIAEEYQQAYEPISDKAAIIRLRSGPRRYIRKERMWPYLPGFADQVLHHIQEVGKIPDVIHAHYADAGLVGANLARLLGTTFAFTGHSLGRVKQQRLISGGQKEDVLESKFNFANRIEAEETAIDTASFVVTSTQQEVEQQYSLYDHYNKDNFIVIPPGVDVERFSTTTTAAGSTIAQELSRFLNNTDLPAILAIARPDEKKNFPTLIEAYANTPGLRDKANLVLIAGTRDDVTELKAPARRVMRQIISAIDKYDLYGHVAIPKKHEPDDIPLLYAYARERKGIFVNPALNEPFGLTLLEAAASGVPVVATNDGGPQEIISRCKNGILIDPLDAQAIGAALESILSDPKLWEQYSTDGLKGVKTHFTWESHAATYVERLRTKVITQASLHDSMFGVKRGKQSRVDRLIIANVDDTLRGAPEGIARFRENLSEAPGTICFAVSSGASLDHTLSVIESVDIPVPEILICAAGTEIFYGRVLVRDMTWEQHISYRWNRNKVRQVLSKLSFLKPQPEEQSTRLKLSYVIEGASEDEKEEVTRHLRRNKLRVNAIISHGRMLDVVPIRASTGLAARYLGLRWGIEPGRILVAGSTGYDKALLNGDTLGVVVNDQNVDLAPLEGYPRVYFAQGEGADGLLEGISHYRFFEDVFTPPDEAGKDA